MPTPAEAALKRAINMLEGILTRQAGLHEQMLALAEDKRDSIISGNVQKLEQTVAAERKVVTEIETEENNRKGVMPLLRSSLGLDQSVEKLADIIAAMPESERERMMAVRNDLKAKVEAVQLKTRHNAELLKTSLGHVEAFLKSVQEAARSGPANYTQKGRLSGGGPAFLDRNA